MKKRLVVFVQVVVFLFAAFGGFLTDIAPPAQTNPKFAVGLSSFLVLILLLIISAVAGGAAAGKLYKKWLVAGIALFVLALVAGFLYPWVLGKLTYVYPPLPEPPEAWRVQGLKYTKQAEDLMKQPPGNWTPGRLELELPYEDIWTADSVGNAKALLLLNYVALVMSIAGAIFCLLEANLKKPIVSNARAAGPAKRRVRKSRKNAEPNIAVEHDKAPTSPISRESTPVPAK